MYDNMQQFRLTKFALTGSKVKLECVAQGTRPIEYRWTRNGRPLTRMKYKAYGPVMKIDKLVLEDSGNFTCVARNVFGSSNCSYALKVYGLFRSISPSTSFSFCLLSLYLIRNSHYLCLALVRHLSQCEVIGCGSCAFRVICWIFLLAVVFRSFLLNICSLVQL